MLALVTELHPDEHFLMLSPHLLPGNPLVSCARFLNLALVGRCTADGQVTRGTITLCARHSCMHTAAADDGNSSAMT